MKFLLSVLGAALLLTLPTVALGVPSHVCDKNPSHPKCVTTTPVPSASPSPTPTPTATATAAPTPTVPATPSATATPTPSPTATPTAPPTRLYGASIYHKRTADLDLAVAAGLNTVRIVNWIDGSTNPYEESRWSLVDSLVAGARSRGLNVLLDLSTYRNHLLNRGFNPYTVDWRPMLDFVDARYDASEVAWLSLAGEVEAPNGGATNKPTTAQLTNFFTTAGTYWRSISTIPVQSGGLLHYGWNSGIDWRAIFDALRVCSVHVYSEGDINALPTIDQFCDSRGYPMFLEEFGRPIGDGDSTRAAYYQRIYDLSRGWDVLFWNLGPETNTGSHDVNQSHPLTWETVTRNR